MGISSQPSFVATIQFAFANNLNTFQEIVTNRPGISINILKPYWNIHTYFLNLKRIRGVRIYLVYNSLVKMVIFEKMFWGLSVRRGGFHHTYALQVEEISK